MSKENPGFLRRTWRFIGKIFGLLRAVIRFFIVLFFIGLIVGLFIDNVRPLPERALLRIAPSGILVEQRAYSDPFTQLLEQGTAHDSETVVKDVIEAIDGAATDKRIIGLVLEPDYLLGGGISKLSDIGAAIERFRAHGKPVIAVADNYTQEQYYFASFADEIHLNPMGAVALTGYGSYGSYFREALDKLKINFHIFRVGEYKDAVEPFMRNDMSTASREHTSRWLNALWQAYTDNVEKRRNLPADSVNNYVNQLDVKLAEVGGDAAQLALQLTLIDKVSTRPQMLARLQELAPEDKSSEEDFAQVGMKEYLFHLRLKSEAQTSNNTIGVVIARGMILDGEQPEGSIGGDTLSELLRTARKDPALRALVVRIDSPGGSAFASDLIRQEILQTRASGIPVVVSMGSVAASGGYWIAADADKIWAADTTLTGSIGVFGMVPTFENSLQSIGIHSDGVGTTELADLYHLDRPLSPKAQRTIQLSVEHIYRKFLQLVADGRNQTTQAVHEIAQGRVWTGAQAQELGLVDELGDLQDAIRSAAELAEISDYRVDYLHRPLTFKDQLLMRLSAGAARIGFSMRRVGLPAELTHWLSAPLVPQLKALTRQLSTLFNFNDPRGIYLHCAECTDI